MRSFLDLAYEVLKDSDIPLTFQEVWEKAVSLGLDKKLNSKGKTPWNSLGSRLYVDVKDNERSRFTKIGKNPVRFYLKDKQNQLSPDIIDKIEKSEASKKAKQLSFKEKELHPLLTRFVYSNPSFNRGKAIYSKTISHEKSKKSGYNEWLHPDMVGFYIPVDDWDQDVIELNRILDNNSILVYSFELKKEISKSNYRESFFQAVSNSSWANEGYLAAAEIQQDDELLAELERLSSSFGIGIIHLDISDIDSSKILYPARRKKELDWETVNKLSVKNPDFKKFLEDVRINCQTGKIYKSEYDKVLEPEEIESRFKA